MNHILKYELKGKGDAHFISVLLQLGKCAE